MQRRIRLGLFGALACALVFLLFEGASSYALFAWDMWKSGSLRIAESRYAQYDPDLGWSSVPNQYIPDLYGPSIYLRTNSRGFRSNREIQDSSPEGKYRVICSGDSMTLGYGVDNEHNWCHLLEAADARVETVNMGQGGYGADQAYLWYRRDGHRLQHHAHIFAVIGDDFERMQKRQFIGYGRPMLRVQGDDLVPDNVPVPKTSAFKRWLALNRPQIEQLRTVQFAARATGQSHRLWASELVSKRPLEATPEKKRLVSSMLQVLQRMNNDKGSKLLVVYLPVRTEYVQDGQPAAWAPGPPPAPAWQKFLQEETERQGIAYINLSPDFQNMPEEEVNSMFIWDRAEIFRALPGHYSEAGNRFVAERIHSKLQELLAPAGSPSDAPQIRASLDGQSR